MCWALTPVAVSRIKGDMGGANSKLGSILGAAGSVGASAVARSDRQPVACFLMALSPHFRLREPPACLFCFPVSGNGKDETRGPVISLAEPSML